MALFAPYYPTLIAHEGYYANDPDDGGGETYMGIARNYWPSWLGWRLIDAYKQRVQWPKNTRSSDGKGQASNLLRRDAELPQLVYAFYEARYWDKQQLGQLHCQCIAEALCDYGVNAGTGRIACSLQYALHHELGLKHVVCDGVLGPQTLSAANAADQPALYQALIELRRCHHYYRATGNVWPRAPLPHEVKRHAALTAYVTGTLKVSYNGTQKKYLRSWLSRTTKAFVK